MLPDQDDAHTQRLRVVRDQVEGLRLLVEARPDQLYLPDRLTAMEEELADLELQELLPTRSADTDTDTGNSCRWAVTCRREGHHDSAPT